MKHEPLLHKLGLTPQEIFNRKLVPISKQYGSCVSFFMPNVLDEMALQYAEELLSQQGDLYAADLGASPYCPQSLRLASTGLKVDAYDLEPINTNVMSLVDTLAGELLYTQINLKELQDKDISHIYDLVYSHRCLFFMPFAQTRKIIELFLSHAKPNARFFISLAGLYSQTGENYADHDKPVAQRFCLPNNDFIKHVGISNPICLYTLEDIENNLLRDLPVKIMYLEETSNRSINFCFEN